MVVKFKLFLKDYINFYFVIFPIRVIIANIDLNLLSYCYFSNLFNAKKIE
jgi:hypothetical protein